MRKKYFTAALFALTLTATVAGPALADTTIVSDNSWTSQDCENARKADSRAVNQGADYACIALDQGNWGYEINK